MTKKRIAMISFFFVLLIAVGYRVYMSYFFDPYVHYRNSNISGKTYSFESPFILKSNEVETGFYDVHVTEGRISSIYGTLNVNQVFYNYFFDKNTENRLEEKGEIKLIPSEFKPLKTTNQGILLENKYGVFQVESEIPEGKYELSVNSDSGDSRFFIQILSDPSNVKESYSVNEKANKKITIELRKGELLEITPDNQSNSDFIINLGYVNKAK
ncbi:hypothetical protein QYB16_002082 [Listeria monocytogenes]|nr:hypothetical protein [Listeria monocytogenes]